MSLLTQFILLSLLTLTMADLSAGTVDIKAGEQKAANCSGCHGAQGKSSNPELPNLAAQQAEYLMTQLNAFKSGSRKNPIMQAMAASLNEQDITNLSAYYASLSTVSAGSDQALAKAGQAKAAMCLGCHGASGQGNSHVPRLAGQQPAYLSQQLHNFKTATRENGPMQAISSNLSEQDIKEITAYFGAM